MQNYVVVYLTKCPSHSMTERAHHLQNHSSTEPYTKDITKEKIEE